MGSGGMSSRLSRGSVSFGGGTTTTPQAPTPQAQPQQQQNIQNQVPTPQNTPVNPQALNNVSQMSDAQLAALVQQAKNTQMPNHLSDQYGYGVDLTQKFVFAAGLNEKPIVLDDKSFDQYMKDNNMTKADLLSRSFDGASFQVGNITFNYSAQQISDMMKYSELNYIGGKKGGQVYGAGTYFDHNGGNSTGYGSTTAIAVLNPKTARYIEKYDLISRAKTFAASHPQFARQVGSPSSGKGGNLSVYALAMGYNCITDSNNNTGYINVIDRSALVYRASNK